MPTEFNTPEETLPGYPGMVVREAEGARVRQSMLWGFPRPMKSKETGLPIKSKPVNNIAGLTNFMWRGIAPKPQWRCLIPVIGNNEPSRRSQPHTLFPAPASDNVAKRKRGRPCIWTAASLSGWKR